MFGLGTNRPVGRGGWNLWRVVVGAGMYLGAALFNTVYTLPRSHDLEGFAEGAWIPFLADFMRNVFMPSGELFMTVVIVFEVIVGLLILGRGTAVDIGVAASILWVLAVLPFLAWPYLLTNFALLFVQGTVLLRRYDRSVWETITNKRADESPPKPLVNA